jgi:hypothetical protein
MGCFPPIMEKVSSLKSSEVVTGALCAQDKVESVKAESQFCPFGSADMPEK